MIIQNKRTGILYGLYCTWGKAFRLDGAGNDCREKGFLVRKDANLSADTVTVHILPQDREQSII